MTLQAANAAFSIDIRTTFLLSYKLVDSTFINSGWDLSYFQETMKRDIEHFTQWLRKHIQFL
jgi:hypothetical protein